jgi:enterobactin synthetase component D
VCFEFGTPSAALPRLLEHGLTLPVELASAVDKRKAEFLAGRYAARHALAELRKEADVARGANGLPIWPKGVVGSITHASGFAAAAVASDAMYVSLGIDAETVMNENTAKSVQRTITSERELSLVEAMFSAGPAGALQSRTLPLTLVFSAKESFYKCVYPLTAEFLEFSDVELVSCRADAPGRGVFALRLLKDLAFGFMSGSELTGRFACLAERVHTLVPLARGFSSETPV